MRAIHGNSPQFRAPGPGERGRVHTAFRRLDLSAASGGAKSSRRLSPSRSRRATGGRKSGCLLSLHVSRARTPAPPTCPRARAQPAAGTCGGFALLTFAVFAIELVLSAWPFRRSSLRWPCAEGLTPRWCLMLIVLLDEPGLFVFRSPGDAVRAIEPIDAEVALRAAFDDSAVPYRVEWLRPNRHRSTLFGLLKTIRPGKYRLVPSGPADQAGLIQLLEAHPEHTDPPEAKTTLAALLRRFRDV